ncbi:MAG: DUF1422 family protein [Candidatus Symbiopectobacterium sp. Dall1.0]|nr:DUF1422 family protein [Candidatus Symbiopectobacterium sp. Dall1.0]
MTKYPHQEKGTLVLALIAGLSVNGSFAALFSSIVPFSVFPLVALVLSVYCLHQRYLNIEMPEGIPLLAAACFLLGLLLYSALVFWIGLRLKKRRPIDDAPAS